MNATSTQESPMGWIGFVSACVFRGVFCCCCCCPCCSVDEGELDTVVWTWLVICVWMNDHLLTLICSAMNILSVFAAMVLGRAVGGWCGVLGGNDKNEYQQEELWGGKKAAQASEGLADSRLWAIWSQISWFQENHDISMVDRLYFC